VAIQVEAIKNIKIDKVTVWDSQGGGNGDGKTATANFLSGMMKSIPPMNEMFKQAGMELPAFLGTEIEEKKDEPVVAAAEAESAATAVSEPVIEVESAQEAEKENKKVYSSKL